MLLVYQKATQLQDFQYSKYYTFEIQKEVKRSDMLRQEEVKKEKKDSAQRRYGKYMYLLVKASAALVHHLPSCRCNLKVVSAESTN